jgi:hypothetical protein
MHISKISSHLFENRGSISARREYLQNVLPPFLIIRYFSLFRIICKRILVYLFTHFSLYLVYITTTKTYYI